MNTSIFIGMVFMRRNRFTLKKRWKAGIHFSRDDEERDFLAIFRVAEVEINSGTAVFFGLKSSCCLSSQIMNGSSL
jgi:hypothetical protein